jgi:hypothetical protein
MLLQCDICGEKASSVAKVPCGFFLEGEDEEIFFIMPKTREAYRDICYQCLFKI